MKKNKITTRISLRANPATASLIEQLAVDVLKAKTLLRDPNVRVFQIPDGTVLEIYGMGFFHPQKDLDGNNAILNFRVENIEVSVGLMLAAGAKSTDGIIKTCDAFSYCHLVLDGSHIVGLYQEG